MWGGSNHVAQRSWPGCFDLALLVWDSGQTSFPCFTHLLNDKYLQTLVTNRDMFNNNRSRAMRLPFSMHYLHEWVRSVHHTYSDLNLLVFLNANFQRKPLTIMSQIRYK